MCEDKVDPEKPKADSGAAKLTIEQQYKLEEMKQLRALITALVQEIAKLEVFTLTAIAAVVVFNMNYEGSSSWVDFATRFGPAAITGILLYKAVSFATRIRLIDKYLKVLETGFLGSEGGWVNYFYTNTKTDGGSAGPTQNRSRRPFFILLERISITSVSFLIGLALAAVPPSEFRKGEKPNNATVSSKSLNQPSQATKQ